MENKINEVFNIIEAEQENAQYLLDRKVCILLGCRVEKEEDDETVFIYSLGQYKHDKKDCYTKMEYYIDYDKNNGSEQLRFVNINTDGGRVDFGVNIYEY